MNKLIFLLLIIFSSNIYAGNMKYSYIEAKYKFYYKKIKAGEMLLKIKKEKDNIQISTTYDGNILAYLGNRDFRQEISLITIKDNKYFPINYTFEDNKSSYSIKYKSKKEIILLDDGADESMALSIKSKNEIHDPLYMLIKIMTNYPNINNKFETISKGRLKIYNYNFSENQTININKEVYSGFTAVHESGGKKNYYFFSQNHENLMVYTKISKNGDERLRIELSELVSIK